MCYGMCNSTRVVDDPLARASNTVRDKAGHSPYQRKTLRLIRASIAAVNESGRRILW